MARLLSRLWSDDSGILIATEYLFILTILIIGTLAGLVALRQAVIVESVELANAIMSLNQSFSFSGQSNCLASVAGSSASDTTSVIIEGSVAASFSAIQQQPCD